MNISLEKPTVESVLKTTMRSGLGLDIAKNSTGISVYDGKGVKTYQSIIEFNEDSDHGLYQMTCELEKDILEVAEGQHFDVIAIEDVIHSVNFDTLRKLILLNSVIDKIITEGKITCDYFRRIGNSVWKKWLRTLRPVKKYETDKVEVESTLGYLGYYVVEQYGDLPNARKEEMGYQDRLDSTGILIGVGLERLNTPETVIKKKERYKLHVDAFSSKDELENFYNLKDLTLIFPRGDLLSSVRTFFSTLDTKEAKLQKYYTIKDTLGTLGLEYGLPDSHTGENYIVMYQEQLK